ncbi:MULTISPECIES: ABC transporter ATP-binding protein [Arthrobacter]|uniref:ABC transporter ATP-binding protein n=2 Tax=Arthrobacter TaxID=1663 RepID=A0ABU9KJQ3_9MICC|nr:ABC transporter ATP-binding protein [Arthrobacter sp. YJM1]MDP5225808.1 ABC transporter ATP-binding protein [Arthrobacter sp. YJM1]
MPDARSFARPADPDDDAVLLRDVVVRAAGEDRRPSRTILTVDGLRLTERRIGVLGANGSGKSTLLRLLNGLQLPDSGSVTVHGLDTRRDGRAVRALVGFVFTDPLSQLVMPTGREDLELSLRRSVPRKDRAARAQEILERFGLATLADQSVYELSGGERQLMALASVLAVEPRVLALDEPSTLLDLRNRELLRRTLAELPQQQVLATHDLELALDMDRVLVVDRAEIVFDGDPASAVAFYRELSLSGTP